MAEYIDREAALSAVDCGNLHKGIVDALQENIKDIPAADVVEVRHGRWEERIVNDPLDPYGFFKRRWYCSSCGRYQTYGTTAFCPRCGARMDGGADK